MIYSQGNDKFVNNEFSFWSWSAPVLQTPNEVMSALSELGLEGRIVKNIYFVGMAYNWRDDDISDAVYDTLCQMTPAQREALPNCTAFLPDGVELLRFAEIDEPVLIEFEDGDVLAVDYSEGSCVRMNMNKIPTDILPSTNRRTIHPNKLFEDIIGKKIVSVQVKVSTQEPEFTGSHGLELDEQPWYVAGLEISYTNGQYWCENGYLSFTSMMDFGVVELRNADGSLQKINAPDVKAVVEGYIDSEVLDSQDENDPEDF